MRWEQGFRIAVPSVIALIVSGTGCSHTARVIVNSTSVETAAHWASPSDFAILRRLGYDLVITTVPHENRASWMELFDAAQASGIELIVGLYPSPYTLQNGVWSISSVGQEFLRDAAERTSIVKATFVYNEPYWIDPLTGIENYCGAMSASALRALRTTILKVWPAARIYHDLGRPSQWAPGGAYYRQQPCVGSKYADAGGVADIVGIWYYPFEVMAYKRSSGLEDLRHEISYVRNTMHAEPIILGQAFQSGRWRFPSASELRDWNCAVRSLGPYAISWYPWRQGSYDDYLSNHPDLWIFTRSRACGGPNQQSIPSIAHSN